MIKLNIWYQFTILTVFLTSLQTQVIDNQLDIQCTLNEPKITFCDHFGVITDNSKISNNDNNCIWRISIVSIGKCQQELHLKVSNIKSIEDSVQIESFKKIIVHFSVFNDTSKTTEIITKTNYIYNVDNDAINLKNENHWKIIADDKSLQTDWIKVPKLPNNDSEEFYFTFLSNLDNTDEGINMMRFIHDNNYDFVVHAGGFTPDLSKNDGVDSDLFFNQYSHYVNSKTPVVITPGSSETRVVIDHLNYRFYMPGVLNYDDSKNNYYSFVYKNVQFFVVNMTYFRNNITYKPLKIELLNWLDKQQSASKKRWKIFISNEPIYCINYNETNCNLYPYYSKSIEDLLTKYRIDVYLSGGLPTYERLNRIKNFLIYGNNSAQSKTNTYKPITPLYAISGLASITFFQKEYIDSFNKEASTKYNGYKRYNYAGLISIKVSINQIKFTEMYNRGFGTFYMGDDFTVTYFGDLIGFSYWVYVGYILQAGLQIATIIFAIMLSIKFCIRDKKIDSADNRLDSENLTAPSNQEKLDLSPSIERYKGILKKTHCCVVRNMNTPASDLKGDEQLMLPKEETNEINIDKSNKLLD